MNIEEVKRLCPEFAEAIDKAFKDLRDFEPEDVMPILQALAEARQALECRPISEAPKGDDCIGGIVFVDLMGRHNRFPNCFYDWATGYWTMRVQYKTKAGARKTVCNALKTDDSWTFREIPTPPSVKEGV